MSHLFRPLRLVLSACFVAAAIVAQVPAPSAPGAPAQAGKPVEASGARPGLTERRWGIVEAGARLPDFALQRADGARLTVASLRGKATVLVVCRADGVPTEAIEALAKLGARAPVQTEVILVGIGQEAFVAWAKANAERLPCGLSRDAAGAFVAKEGEEQRAARAAFHRTTIVGQAFGPGRVPILPSLVVVAADGTLVGSSAMLEGWSDGVANLLLQAGVELPADSMPKVVVPAADLARVAAPAGPAAEAALLAVGAAAPDFEMLDAAGRPVSLAALRGKVVVLDFWATWCKPCLAAMPHCQEIAAKYAAQDVVVIASCTRDEREKFVEWLGKNQATYPGLLFACDPLGKSPERASLKLYGVRSIPCQFVIDRDGKVAATVSGYLMSRGSPKGDVRLEASLAKAGVKVDAEILEDAADLQRRADERRGKASPAVDKGASPAAGG